MDISAMTMPEDGALPRMQDIKLDSSIPVNRHRPTWQTTMLSPSPSPQTSPAGKIERIDVRGGNGSTTPPTQASSPTDECPRSNDQHKATPKDEKNVPASSAIHSHNAQTSRGSYVSPTTSHPPSLPVGSPSPPRHALHLSPTRIPFEDRRSGPYDPNDLEKERGYFGGESGNEDQDQVLYRSKPCQGESNDSAQLKPVYRSPPPLPRLDTGQIIRTLSPPSPQVRVRAHSSSEGDQQPRAANGDADGDGDGATQPRSLSRSPHESQTRLPAVYATMREFYPTPVTVIERTRWPAPHEDRSQQSQAPHPQAQPQHTNSVPPHIVTAAHAPPHGYPAVYGYELYDPYALAPPPSRAYPPQARPAGYAHHPNPSYPLMRPRLQIHPYAPPPIDTRYHSAGPLAPQPHLMGLAAPARGYASPASAISPEGCKAPRKRADDVQLAQLNEVFERTSYPSTEEREDLARRLGMTSRSVQIWFQNRRRAVKVEQQSAQQRVEADVRLSEARARGLPGPPLHFNEAIGGYSVSPATSPSLAPGIPSRSGSLGQLGVSILPRGDTPVPPHSTVKREIPSPERRF